MDCLATKRFINGLKRFNAPTQKQIHEKIEQLLTHPKLPNDHRFTKGGKNKWICYVNNGDRLIYERKSDQELILWWTGSHTDMDHLQADAFQHGHLESYQLPQKAKNSPQPALFDSDSAPSYATAPIDGSPNPYQDTPDTHLRILGVPQQHIKTVKRFTTLEEVEESGLLSERALNWMLDIATRVNHGMELIYRFSLDELQGFTEGKLKRLMLNLTDDQRQYVDRDLGRMSLLRGCAGSGKTSILIQRAVRLMKAKQRVLVLTFNKELAGYLNDWIAELDPTIPAEVTNIDSYINQPAFSPPRIDKNEVTDALRSALQAVKQLTTATVLNKPPEFFEDEISKIIKSNALQSLSQYLRWERVGRKTPLQEGARRVVWQVYEAYEQELRERGVSDWEGRVLHAINILKQPTRIMPYYDHVLIDEAQDMTAAKLLVAQQLVKPQTGSLFMVGDSAQTLYTRGFSYTQIGLEVRGYSFRLKRNFRSTKQIALAGAKLLEHKTLKDATELVDPEQCMREMIPPQLIHYHDENSAFHRIKEQILELCAGDDSEKFRFSDVAIFCTNRDMCSRIAGTLGTANIPIDNRAISTNKSSHILDNCVKIMTLHSAKGLEFPVVFLMGLKEGDLPHWSLDKSEEPEIELDRQRTLLYVGLTRASEVCYLVAPHQSESRFIQEFGDTIRVMHGQSAYPSVSDLDIPF